MRIKKWAAVILVLVLMFSGISVYATQCQDNFTLYAGSASSVTSARKKNVSNNRCLYVYPAAQTYSQWSTQWPSGVNINFRGRTSSDAYATYLLTTSTAGDHSISYYSNSGYVGNYYKLASNLPSGQGCSVVYITAYWTP